MEKDKDCDVDGNDGAIGFLKTQDGRKLVPVSKTSTIKHVPDMELIQTPSDPDGRCYPAEPSGRLLHFVVLLHGKAVLGNLRRETLARYDTLDEAMTLIDRLAHWLDDQRDLDGSIQRVFDIQHASEHLKNRFPGDTFCKAMECQGRTGRAVAPDKKAMQPTPEAELPAPGDIQWALAGNAKKNIKVDGITYRLYVIGDVKIIIPDTKELTAKVVEQVASKLKTVTAHLDVL